VVVHEHQKLPLVITLNFGVDRPFLVLVAISMSLHIQLDAVVLALEEQAKTFSILFTHWI
jgi:hypothetical protein